MEICREDSSAHGLEARCELHDMGTTGRTIDGPRILGETSRIEVETYCGFKNYLRRWENLRRSYDLLALAYLPCKPANILNHVLVVTFLPSRQRVARGAIAELGPPASAAGPSYRRMRFTLRKAPVMVFALRGNTSAVVARK